MNILQNPRVLARNLDGLVAIWKLPYDGFYIPLTYSVWFAIAKLSKTPDPSLFHLANTCLHVVNVLLVFKLVHILLDTTLNKARSKTSAIAAALGTLVFAVHPLQVEPVAWVTGLRDVLSTFFGLLSLLFFIRSFSPSKVHPGKYLAATACFLSALLAKPAMAIIPAAAIVTSLPSRNHHSNLSRAICWTLPWIFCSAFVCLQTAFLQNNAAHPDLPLYLRPLVAVDALGFYFWKLVFPFHLCVNYDHNLDRIREIIPELPHLITGLAMIVGSLLVGRRRPEYVRPMLLALAGLAPTLGIAPFLFQRYSITADRYLYFSMIGMAWALAIFLSQHASQAAKVLVCCISLTWLLQTSLQIEAWANSRSLYGHTIAVGGDQATAHMQLAESFRRDGQIEESLLHARKAVELRPHDPETATMLGAALLADRKYDEAEAEFRKSLALDSTGIDARWGLGKALMALNQPSEGEREFLSALRLNPRYLPALYALEDYYKKSNRTDNAAWCTKRIAEIAPYFGE